MKPHETAPVTRRRQRAVLLAPMSEINMIPLVDVTLVLLIIFMVTTAFVKDQQTGKAPKELPVTLPYSAAASVNTSQPEHLVIGVDRSGQRYVGTSAVTTDALIAAVKAAATKDPSQHVRIDADQDTRFSNVVELMELCEFEGLHNIGVHTRDQH